MSLNKVNKNMIDNSYMPSAFVGSIISIFATDTYIPNGCVKPDGVEYTREQFTSFYDNFLVTGKILTCTYEIFAAQVALTGNCAKFALDTDAQKFKVPLLKDGDSITHAASATEMGKSVKAGLPNITASRDNSISQGGTMAIGATFKGAFTTSSTQLWGASNYAQSILARGADLKFDASLSNPIYGNSDSVTDEQVRLRHFVVLVSAQNSASAFDWSNYIASLAVKANVGLDNVPELPQPLIKNALNASGDAPAYACRAWVNFNGTGIVAIRASGNVSSIVDNGVGLYTINFLINIVDASYATVAEANNGAAGLQCFTHCYSQNVSSCSISTREQGTTNVDRNQVSFVVLR